MTAIPSLGFPSNAARIEAEMKQFFEDVLATMRQLPGGSEAQSTLTLATDKITPTRWHHLVSTEGGAASDNLANIVATNLPDGSLFLVGIESSSRVVVVKHAAGGAGQISLANGADFTMNDTTSFLLLKLNGTVWEERGRWYGNAALAHRTFYGTPGLTDANTFTKRQLLAAGVDIASAATLTPGTDGNYFHVTGTVGVTAIATLQRGARIAFEFDSSGLVITHNATSLVMLTGRSYTTVAGDVLEFISEGSGNWRQVIGPVTGTSIADVFTISEDFITGLSLSPNAPNQFTYLWNFMNNNGATITRAADGRGVLDLLGSASGNAGVQLVNETTNLFTAVSVSPATRFRFGRLGGSAIVARRAGLMDSMPTTGAPNNGIFIYFTNTNYFGFCINATAATNIDLGVASVDGTEDKFEIRATPTAVTFFVNGVNRGTITTNIPTAGLGPVAYFEPNGVNATGNGLRIDYFETVGVR